MPFWVIKLRFQVLLQENNNFSQFDWNKEQRNFRLGVTKTPYYSSFGLCIAFCHWQAIFFLKVRH